MAADYIPRDSVRYSMVKAEWPALKERLLRLLRSVESNQILRDEDPTIRVR